MLSQWATWLSCIARSHVHHVAITHCLHHMHSHTYTNHMHSYSNTYLSSTADSVSNMAFMQCMFTRAPCGDRTSLHALTHIERLYTIYMENAHSSWEMCASYFLLVEVVTIRLAYFFFYSLAFVFQHSLMFMCWFTTTIACFFFFSWPEVKTSLPLGGRLLFFRFCWPMDLEEVTKAWSPLLRTSWFAWDWDSYKRREISSSKLKLSLPLVRSHIVVARALETNCLSEKTSSMLSSCSMKSLIFVKNASMASLSGIFVSLSFSLSITTLASFLCL